MPRLVRHLLFLTFCIVLTACTANHKTSAPLPGRPLSGTLRIGGSTTLLPLVESLSQRFQSLHPDVVITVEGGGSARGLEDVRADRLDIGMLSRALLPDEKDLFAFPIARDGICLVVHHSNPVQSLSRAQITDLYAGKIKNWQNLGGARVPVMAIHRTPMNTEVQPFHTYFALHTKPIQAANQADTNRESLDLVLQNPGAVVYLSLGQASRAIARGAPIKVLALDGVLPSPHNIRSGAFPLSRTLNLITRKKPAGLTAAFIEFALSPQITDEVQTYHFVPYLD